MSARTRSRLRLWALIGLGTASIALLVKAIGAGAISAELRRIGPEALLILLPYAAGTALAAFPWSWLLGTRLRLSHGAALASRFAASSANAVLPLFGAAGEACRLLWLPSPVRSAGVAALLVERSIYNASGGLLLLVGATAALATPLPVALSVAGFGVALLMLLGTAVVLLGLRRWGLCRGLQRWLGRCSPRLQSTLGADVEGALAELWNDPQRPFLRSLIVHLAARIVLGIEIYIALWSLDAAATPAQVAVFVTAPIVSSLVASGIPGQVGLQEGAQALVSSALGLDPALGFSLVLLQRMRQLIFVPLAPLLIAAARPQAVEQALDARTF